MQRSVRCLDWESEDWQRACGDVWRNQGMGDSRMSMVILVTETMSWRKE